ncbi:MAG TPA: PHP domain-containing protein [Candidatus Omnitrophica bacterium]|nr:PHP domain-containing protein [Candidatus Omnitrophota bacterium]
MRNIFYSELLDKDYTKGYADLHLHTIYSDGEYTPEEAVQISLSLGFRAISVTDHDTVKAIPLIAEEARGKLEVIPGVELSAEGRGEEVHITGLLIDYRDPTLLKTLEELSHARRERMCKMLDRLKEMGMPIEMKEVGEFIKGEIIGRMHLAQAMEKKGYVKDIWEAFDNFIGDGKPAYVRRERLKLDETISLIKKTGGIPVLAHPQLLRDKSIIPHLVKEGLEGIEVYHPDHGENPSSVFLKIAKRYNLLLSGGSDCHGLAKEQRFLGSVKVPYQLVEELKRWKEKMRK